MVSSVAGLLRLASFVICVIVVTSFAFFALDQTKTASSRQARITASEGDPLAPGPASSSAPHRSPVRKGIDAASGGLTSPFAGVVSSATGEWTVRAVKLLLALAIYGFGLGYLARMIRIRV